MLKKAKAELDKSRNDEDASCSSQQVTMPKRKPLLPQSEGESSCSRKSEEQLAADRNRSDEADKRKQQLQAKALPLQARRRRSTGGTAV